MAKKEVDPEFPCSLVIRTPFPTHRLASSALKALQVDAELSPLVRRSFSLISSSPNPSTATTASKPSPLSNGTSNASATNGTATQNGTSTSSKTVLVTEYKATTNRMLRVAVNGFMESLGVVLGVMEKLDVDVMPPSGTPAAPATAAAK
ncbi:hypothetical protein MMC10_009008 [Thelotrema lepadinum]|nr:hypothetical protein [Thelotrema lepadinum]